MTIKPKITELLKRLNDGVIEKEEVIALSLLSSVAGESIFLLGPPGVAKSLVARRLKYAFKEGSSFEYLMNRFSTPDEIFGPVSIKQLRDEDKYQRVVENYLPTATVVFLDEIWKAGPSIQNALLTVLNEKIYRNGEQEIKVPMKALISASNELPSKGEGLEALWDRFLVRIVVDGVQDKQNFNDMISKSLNSYSDTVKDLFKISNDEFKKWNKDIDKIEIPENVFNVIHVIRNYIEQYNKREKNKDKQIYISDRRWRKIVRLLRTSAFLNDRISVDLMDCFLIKYCLWNEVEQIEATSQFVKDAIQKHGYSLKFNFKFLKDELEAFKTEIEGKTKFVKDTREEVLQLTKNCCYEILGMDKFNKFISLEDFHRLLLFKTKEKIRLYFLDSYNSNFQYGNVHQISIGNSKTSVFINGNEFKLKSQIIGDKRQIIRKPDIKLEEVWDTKVETFFKFTNDLKETLEYYRNTDLKHFRINLFAKHDFANIVETQITEIRKEIEKIEVEIRKIQNDYKKLKDEEKIVE